MKMVQRDGQTLEQLCEKRAHFLTKAKKKKLNQSYIDSNYESWQKYLEDEYGDMQVFFMGEMYMVNITESVKDGSPTIIEMQQKLDGSIEFVTQFWNGGTCLSEMLERGLKKIR